LVILTAIAFENLALAIGNIAFTWDWPKVILKRPKILG
jgi:hypothetical protein